MKYLFIFMIWMPVVCPAQNEINYQGLRLKLLHNATFNPFYDSIVFNKSRDTAYIFHSAVYLTRPSKPGDNATANFVNAKNEKLYFYRWEYFDDLERALGENYIWSARTPDSADVVAKYYLPSDKQNFRLVIQPATSGHLYNQQQNTGGVKPLNPNDLNLSREEHHTK